MKICVIEVHRNKFWGRATIKIGDQKINVNYDYEVTPDWIYLYDCIGGQGTGYQRGSLIGKIYIGDCELMTYECNEMSDGPITKTIKS